MLGFSMITLSFLILGLFVLLFFIAAAAALQYELARRGDNAKRKRKNSDDVKFA